jgi:hypothetical protein
MGLYTGTVRGLHRAPYRDQVIVHLINKGCAIELSVAEEAKIVRVARFLDAYRCAEEIAFARQAKPRRV